MKPTSRHSRNHPEPSTIVRAATVTLLAAAMIGVPATAQARTVADRHQVSGYGSGV